MEAKVKAAHFSKDVLDWFLSLPNHWIYVAGVVVASIPLSTLIVEYVKHLHLKVTSTEMTNHLIGFTVTVTAILMTTADFLITNGTNLSHFLPFLAVAMPVIKAFAPDVYDYSKAINNWSKNRKNENQQQRLQAVVAAADNVINQPGFAPLSNGTASNNVTPSDNLLQL